MSKAAAVVLAAVLSAFGGAAIAVGVAFFVWGYHPAPATPAATTNDQANATVTNQVATSNEATNNTTTSSDDRTLLTVDSNGSYYPGKGEAPCTDFSTAAPTTTVNYSSAKRGLSMEVPYNPAWGNDQYRINAFDDIDDSQTPFGAGSPAAILLGPIVSGLEGCGWVRPASITLTKAQTADQVIAALKAEASPDFPFETLKKTTINGTTVVRWTYTSASICGGPYFEVPGSKFNYQLNDCFTPPHFPAAEKLIETMQVD
ncbi:MAG: hypothetical protein U0514_04480 [Candidatus Andersenbacteria bacterium]